MSRAKFPIGDLTREHQRLIERCAQHYAETNKTESTVKGILLGGRQLLTYLEGRDADLNDLDGIMMEDFMTSPHDGLAGYSGGTRRTRYYSIRSFLRYCEGRVEGVSRDHLDGFDLTDYSATDEDGVKIEHVKPDIVRTLVQNVRTPKNRNELIVKLGYNTGLRPGEVTGITMNDVHWDDRRIEIDTLKGGANRDVWWAPEIDPLMRRWRVDREAMPYVSESNRLFMSRYSPKMNSSRPNKVVRDAAKDAGILKVVDEYVDGSEKKKPDYKSLRHTYGVECVRSGMDISVLQDRMGHKNIRITKEYLRFRKDTQRKMDREHSPIL